MTRGSRRLAHDTLSNRPTEALRDGAEVGSICGYYGLRECPRAGEQGNHCTHAIHRDPAET